MMGWPTAWRSSCPTCGAATRGAHWLQADLDLRGRDDVAQTAVLADVFGLVDSMRRDRRLHRFFFMRKAPGLRLRFQFHQERDADVQSTESALSSLRARRLIRRWVPVAYEPETYKFGGAQALEAAHAHFDGDSRNWWRWDQTRRGGRASVDAQLLSTAVLNDLFTRCLEGPEEVWDVWCRMAALHGGLPARQSHACAAPNIATLLDGVSPGERAVLRGYVSHNAALARRLAALHSRGRLLVGRRLVLPHIALYHWNRYGFTLAERAAMYDLMQCAWSPFPHADN
jgi:thiopeptide-type bacteriocin biosynthesis protein